MPEAQTARELAAAHRLTDPGTTTVMYFPGGDSIRLLEVSSSARTTDEIPPFTFRAAPTNDVPFPSTIILVSPDEWTRIRQGGLALPAGWDLATAEEV